MKKKILIVEDEYVEANDLRLIIEKAGYQVVGIARSVQQGLELADRESPDLALLDISLKGKLTGIDLAKMLGPRNIPFIFLSANCSAETLDAAKATQPYGYLVKPFRTNDVLIAIGIAQYRHANNIETMLHQQALLQTQLNAIAAESLNTESRLLKAGKVLQSYFPFDYLGCELYQDKIALKELYSYYRVGFDEYQSINEKEIADSTGIDCANYAFIRDVSKTARPEAGPIAENGILTSEIQKKMIRQLKMNGLLTIPLDLGNNKWLWFYLASRQADGFQAKHIELINRLNAALVDAIKGIVGLRTVTGRWPSVSYSNAENSFFDGFIGKSHLLLSVFDQIKQVAPMDTSILILGESGTGKEKIAECIHRHSSRRNGPFIKINCAGFPASLIESELFGHEKGSFTGAQERRIGKFEMADKGTILLDEIGEMPLESQVKILRVLQERQIERIGGRDSTKVDIRIIAATNRNLEEEVANDRFRLDLYYRLNVFPITLPPLRDRIDDIPDLVAHFIQLFNQKTGRQIIGASNEVIRALQNHWWPGNIRELEHVVERCLIMCKGNMLDHVTIPTALKKPAPAPAAAEKVEQKNDFKSLKEFEKEYLLDVLRKCNGRLSGKDGAAQILGLPVSTLNSKLIKLGIKRDGNFSNE